MSKTSDFIRSGAARNFQPRTVLDAAIDKITAARAKIASAPAVACIELDEAMVNCAKVIRGLDPGFDFGFPDSNQERAIREEANNLRRDWDNALAAALAPERATIEALRARVVELEARPKAPPPAVLVQPVEVEDAAPSRRGRKKAEEPEG